MYKISCNMKYTMKGSYDSGFSGTKKESEVGISSVQSFVFEVEEPVFSTSTKSAEIETSNAVV